MPIRHALSTTNLALVAVFAGLIAASTLWPGAELLHDVPITLQTLAVLLAGAALGPWRGALAVILYLVVGTAGAPIFAGRTGGLSAWTGTTAGFLAGFVLAAWVTGLLVKGMRVRGQLSTTGIVGACAVGSLFVLNVIGWGYIALRFHVSLRDTATAASPFLVGDIIKVFVAGVAAAAVHRAYPSLLGVTRSTDAGLAAPLAPSVASAGHPVAS